MIDAEAILRRLGELAEILAITTAEVQRLRAQTPEKRPTAKPAPKAEALRHVVGIRSIIAEVEAERGLLAGTILGRARDARIVEARQEAMLRAREAGHTLAAIGSVMRYHHTTVMHGAMKAEQRRAALK